MSRRSYWPWLHRYAVLVSCAAFLLIVAGALVTSNDAGLSVPDWPTTFGSFRMPRMVGGVRFEHGHRMVAGLVTILTMALAVWIWRCDSRRWMRRLAGVSVLTILLQVLLGGVTVLFYLPVIISVSHASIAQVFFGLTVCMALFSGRGWHWDEDKLDDPASPSLRSLAAWTAALILLQLMAGAALRHNGFGIVPHAAGSALVAVGIFWIAVRVFSSFAGE